MLTMIECIRLLLTMKRDDMNIYLAPIQGVTIAPYRNFYNNFFGGIDAYYAPFISPTSVQETHPSFFDDIKTEVNTCQLVPQLLGNDGDHFRHYARIISQMGYEEINWNIGCSFSIVTKKKKGAGILAHPDMISKFLDEVCKDSNYKLSVKMRLGMNSTEEGFRVIERLNDYPISNITIHARTGKQQYKGPVDLEGFKSIYQESNHPITYNGDIFNINDYKQLMATCPDLKHIMLGRGGLIDPFLAKEIKGYPSLTNKVELIQQFHDTMFDHYELNTTRDLHLLNKMKEFWTYTHVHLDHDHKLIKEIRLSQNVSDYLKVTKKILNSNIDWI